MKPPFTPLNITIVVILLILGIVLLVRTNADRQDSFQTPKKAAHFESSTPAHETTLAGVPINVVIDFNFDLTQGSSILIKSEGKEFGTGETVIDENKLAMRRTVTGDAPDGLYTVDYKACWPDNSCHNGRFQFKIDRSLAEQFEDLRGQPEVTIDMAEIMFQPRDIRISRDTTVTWKNSDEEEHFVNTDAHPAHTYFTPQNSRGLQKGESYSTTFSIPSIYPYHCSAHADTMVGTILVE